MSSVFLNQVMVYSGEPSTVQVKNRVLLMPVFRFLGDKVTRSGSVRGQSRNAGIQKQVQKGICLSFLFLVRVIK